MASHPSSINGRSSLFFKHPDKTMTYTKWPISECDSVIYDTQIPKPNSTVYYDISTHILHWRCKGVWNRKAIQTGNIYRLSTTTFSSRSIKR